MQLESLFDLAPTQQSQVTLEVKLELPDDWNLGLIVGPSGAGKTRIAEALFPAQIVRGFDWPKTKSILDGFPPALSIKDVTQLLSSVGFSSPPSWLRPFQVLSNGEQFRVTIARALAEAASSPSPPSGERTRVRGRGRNSLAPIGGEGRGEGVPITVIDEFTSVVDRTVAKVGSAAIAKTVRRRRQRLIALSCHYDVVPWLAPDWIYQPHIGKLDLPRGSLQRPPLQLEIRRVHPNAWSLFKPHHYLTARMHARATCFCAFLDGQPVAFDAWLPFVGAASRIQAARRGHRTVCLPDYQGVGIGNALFTHDAALWKALGYRALSCTGHPAEIHRRQRSPDWAMTRKPSRVAASDRGLPQFHATRSKNRITASFEYVGPALDLATAKALIGWTK
jgi:GNAT superfamily N-acetyltransferase